jgi:hypothetical protein
MAMSLTIPTGSAYLVDKARRKTLEKIGLADIRDIHAVELAHRVVVTDGARSRVLKDRN